MPKEVTINAWCDPCFREGKRVEAEEYTLAFGDLARLQPRSLLLCEGHRSKAYDPLRMLAEEFGAKLGGDTSHSKRPKQENEEDLTCPHGCFNGKVFKSSRGKKQHMTRWHKDAA